MNKGGKEVKDGKRKQGREVGESILGGTPGLRTLKRKLVCEEKRRKRKT